MEVKEKKQLILRIPHALWEELNQMAEDELRSLNGQIEYILTKAVRNSKSKKEVIIEKVIGDLAEADINIVVPSDIVKKNNLQ